MGTSKLRDTRNTKNLAMGQWESILRELAPTLNHALDKVPNHVACPKTGNGKDNFRLFRDVNRTGGGYSNIEGSFSDGFNLLMWVNDWSFVDAHDAVYEYLFGKEYNHVEASYDPWKSDGRKPAPKVRPGLNTKESAPKPYEQNNAARDSNVRGLLNKLRLGAMPLNTSEAQPAMTYLARRRCFPLPWDMQDLRFHPSLQCKDEDDKPLIFPGLVARVTDPQGRPVTWHRTLLSHDGVKAPIEKPKRLMPVPSDRSIAESAVRLQPKDWRGDTIGIAEGIETALCVSCATQTVCWSVLSATFMAHFQPPPWIKTVFVWADWDPAKIVVRGGKDVDVGSAGQTAARKLYDRLMSQGVRVVIKLPPLSGLPAGQSVDWADIYEMYGSEGFKSLTPERK